MGYFTATELKEVKLPSDDKYWVKIVTNLKYGDLKGFATLDNEGSVNFSESADIFLKTVIKEWNLDDENGVVLPITPENINRLDQADALFILNQSTSLVETEDQKKTLSNK